MEAYQNLSYEEYIRRNSSEYVHSIQNLSGQYQNVLTSVLRTVSDSLISISIFIFLAYENYQVLIILISLVILIVISFDQIFRERLKRLREDFKQIFYFNSKKY